MRVKVRITFDRRKHEIHIQANEPIFPVQRVGTFNIELRKTETGFDRLRQSTDGISAYPASFMTLIRTIMAHHWVRGGSVTKRNMHIYLDDSITTATWRESTREAISRDLHAFAAAGSHDIRVSGTGQAKPNHCLIGDQMMALSSYIQTEAALS